VKKNVTWVVVADHQRGHVFANEGPGRGLQPVEGMSFETHLATDHELVSDRLPRSINSQGGARHGIEPRVDPHRQEALRFISQIVEAIVGAAERQEFDRLLLIAPPRALGEIRKLLPHRVRDRVIGELDQDLTRASTESLREHVAPFLAV
jgi:protein required for attachment to host cells